MERRSIEKKTLKILCLEDSAQDAEIISELLNDAGFGLSMEWIDTAEKFKAALRDNTYDLILSDFGLPGFDAFVALRMANDICPDVPFICVSGSIGEETAIKLIMQGAVDYVLKDRLVRLPTAIQRALDEVEQRKARRRTEEALRESEDRFRLLFESSMDAVLLSSPTGEIFSANPATCKMLGRTEEEICAVGRNGFMDSTDPRLAAALEELARTGKFIGELTLLRKDGTQFPAEVSTSIFDDQHGHDRSSMIIRDITERKQSEENMRLIEERLRQSEKMDAIGQLAGGIAHDFNNVLGGIIGYTDISLTLVEKNSPIEGNLLKVLKAAERAKHLVQQILTFSRQGSSQKTITTIRPILSEVLDLLKASIPSSVIIDVDLLPETMLVLADTTQIHEALLNLATNAVHAMRRKGRLKFRLYKEVLEKVEHSRNGDMMPGDYAVMQISDTGCGMDAVTLSKAFEPFFTTKPVGEGTGMGLSVVLGIVQSHSGYIRVESQPGKGTDIRIYLPMMKESKAASVDHVTRTLPSGSERIMFVDDEPMLVEMNIDLLTGLGYTVTGMSNSMEVLKFLTKNVNDIDILITDQTMPGMTGMELAREVLKIRKDLPIILCTGFSNEVNPMQAAAVGINQFIMKPYRSHEISRAIREVLDSVKQ
jgi:PAS domain S-box-containing protein